MQSVAHCEREARRTAFTGEGASKTGGRWNSHGVFLVYTSSTKSLATLESLVHLNPPGPLNTSPSR